MQARVVGSAFVSWHDAVLTSRQLAATGARVVARMQHCSMGRAFVQWTDATEQLQQLKRIGTRWQQLHVHRSFMTWVESVEAIVVARDEAEHEETLARVRVEIEMERVCV